MVDNIASGDWDLLAYRISKYFSVKKNEDFESIKKRLKSFLENDIRSQHFVIPANWRQVWKALVPRFIKLDETFKRIYSSHSGHPDFYSLDRTKTAKFVTEDVKEFEKKTAGRADLDRVDTKNGDFVLKK